MNDRLSWDEYALKIAEVTALRSEDPYMKVGACVLNKDNRVIGVGYNGLASSINAPEGFWDDRDRRRKYMIHAEANALAHVYRGQAELLACTLLPCSSCATLIAAYGIKKVVFKETYHRDTSSFEIFDFYKIDYKQYETL
jgi:dCMP deaminase